MLAASGSPGMSRTKDWSIFRMSTGMLRSRDRDEYPVPKSSMAIRTPAACSSRRAAACGRGRPSSADSVTSTGRSARVDALARIARQDAAGEVRAAAAARGDRLNPPRSSAPRRATRAAGGTARATHPVADRLDEAHLLRERDELARRDEAAVGVLPADQRLDLVHVARSRPTIGW